MQRGNEKIENKIDGVRQELNTLRKVNKEIKKENRNLKGKIEAQEKQ